MKSSRIFLVILSIMVCLILLVGCRKYNNEKETKVTDEKKISVEESFSLEIEETQSGKNPWDKFGNHFSEYTWEEYEALSEEEKSAFQKSFNNIEAFDNWLMKAQSNAILPWQNGGKQPSEYTWEEYEALSDFLKDAFFESFDSAQNFDLWLKKTQNSKLLSWESGGKQPSEYTWEEYEALSEEEKSAFQKSFNNIEAFDNWLVKAQSNAILPWQNGGKQPPEYTWEEYEVLSDFLKDAFFESFDNIHGYNEWISRNKPQ